MRKTLLTIATVGLLGLSTVSGAFAQTEAAVNQAVTAASAACGGTGTPATCLAAVVQVKAALASAALAGVSLTAPLVFNGVTIAAAGPIDIAAAVDIYDEIVVEVQATPQGADTTIATQLAAELAVTEEEFAESASPA